MPRLVAPHLDPGAMSERGQPTLDAGPLWVLRPFVEEDAAELVDAYEDPLIQHWHLRDMAGPDEARGWIRSSRSDWEAEEGGNWRIGTRTGSLVGRLGFRNVDLSVGRAEVSYWVVPEHRGQGAAVAAVDAVATWGFGTLGLRRLELDHSVRNPASCRVAERAGFAVEGTRRDGLLHADGWHDMHLHARLSPFPRTVAV